jgi:hypothetical protein
MPPVGALDLPPPRRRGDAARRREVIGKEAAEDERPTVVLGAGPMAGGGGEGAELVVGHGARRDPERRQRDVVDRALAISGVAVTRRVAHGERAPGQRDEPVAAFCGRAAAHRFLLIAVAVTPASLQLIRSAPPARAPSTVPT